MITDQGPAVHRVHLVGPHPILLHFLGRMDFPRIVRACLGSRHRGILDHAQTLAVFIQNIILSPAPLYRIAEWAHPIDPVALELTASEKRSLNDDRVARSLDALVTPRARTLFFRLAVHVIEQFELDTKRIHHDTTTVTFSAKHNCQQFLVVRIASQTQIETKRLRRGRPRKGDPVKKIRTRVYHLEVSRNKEALRAEARTDGVFPLTTNQAKAPMKEILLIYKYQPYVEKRHALFKSELEVAPVYIKKPLRAVGLVHAVFLAMTLDALIERTVRQAMAHDGIKSLPILPEGRQTKTPTTARILEMFSDVCWYEFERGGETVTFPIRVSQLQKQLLQLLDIDSSAYA